VRTRRAGDGRDDAVGADPADAAAVGVGDEQVAGGVDRHPSGAVARR
jgi:hypothetical protein